VISTIVDSKDEPKEKPFPKLMKDEDGWVFLMVDSASVCICVFIPNEDVGKYASNFVGENWGNRIPNNLTDFHGTIQLRNE